MAMVQKDYWRLQAIKISLFYIAKHCCDNFVINIVLPLMDNIFHLSNIIIFSLLLSACNPIRDEDRMCNAAQKNTGKETIHQYANGYFSKEFAERVEIDSCGRELPFLSEFETEWYTKEWSIACEPSLYKPSLDNQSSFGLRFSYMPSFDSNGFFRLKNDNGKHKLIVKKMTYNIGINPDIIERSKEILLSDAEVNYIREQLEIMRANRAELISIRAKAQKVGGRSCGAMMDGIKWIIETTDGGEYDMFIFQSPSGGPATNIGELLIKKSGWWD